MRIIRLALIALLLAAPRARGAGDHESSSKPRTYRAGSHLQLVREHFTSAQGLPSVDIQAVAVTSEGIVLISAGGTLVVKEKEGWRAREDVPEVKALVAPLRGAQALAAARDGVWVLAEGRWRRDEGGPAGAIALAVDREGTAWAASSEGAWIRAGGWRAFYLAGLERMWGYERAEANPLWSFIYGASTGRPCDVEGAVESLREMPLDLIDWPVKNSHRDDLKHMLTPDGQLSRPLPWTERPVHKWDHTPYRLDDGSGLGEVDQSSMWLLPYWMGRHHGLIE